MAFMPFTKEDQPTMAKFNEKFLEAILEGKTQALDAGVKIATGSYTGTGTYGADNKNTLTFGFVPKLVVVCGAEVDAWSNANPIQCTFVNPHTVAGSLISSGGNNANTAQTSVLAVTFSGQTISWYNNESSVSTAKKQLNVSGVTYNYIAIG